MRFSLQNSEHTKLNMHKSMFKPENGRSTKIYVWHFNCSVWYVKDIMFKVLSIMEKTISSFRISTASDFTLFHSWFLSSYAPVCCWRTVQLPLLGTLVLTISIASISISSFFFLLFSCCFTEAPPFASNLQLVAISSWNRFKEIIRDGI